MNPSKSRIAAALFFTFVLLATGDRFAERGASADTSGQRRYQVSFEEAFGLKTAVFATPEGTIRVNMPDDAAFGDTLSGTVYLAPAGNTDEERQKNRAEMTNYVVDVAGVRSPAGERVVRFDLPESGKDDDEFKVVLRNPTGRELSDLGIAALPEAPVQPAEFDPPALGQTGKWVDTPGPFDGDISNTVFSIGGVAANPLAESPRRTLFQSPVNVIGPATLLLQEAGTEITQTFRNINVALGATKLNLQRGETSNLTVTVQGLQGIQQDVQVHLSCSGSADMQGGNNQNVQISPSEVGPDGSVTRQKVLTGNKIGGFTVTANVRSERAALKLTDQPVHVERNPVNIGNENDKVWWIKVKTLDGQLKDIYISQDFRPPLEICNWIKIDGTRKEEGTGFVYATGYQKVEDPTSPCELKDKTVKVEGDPIGPINGGWEIRVTGPDGKSVYIYVQSPEKPNVKKGQWIRIRDCKKLSSNSYSVSGYDVTDDPNKPPPAPAAPSPTPTPKPTPRADPIPNPAICSDGATRRRRTVRKTFEVMTAESEVIFKIYPDKDSGTAADNMAAWLNGSKPIRDFVGDNLPEGTGAGGAAAGAVLQYVDTAADIITALAKSRLRNLAVTDVTADLFVTTKKITATCTTYEVCIAGRWVERSEYSETSTDSTYRRSKKVTKGGVGWEKVSVTSQPQFFDPDKAEDWGKEYLKSELNKLKRQGEDYEAFRKKCGG